MGDAQQNNEVETQSTQSTQCQDQVIREQPVEPVTAYIIKYLRYLPPAFELYLEDWIMKIGIDSQKYVDCSQYMSKSGLTWNGCYIFKNSNLTQTTGLYIVNSWPKLNIESTQKIKRDIDEMQKMIKDTLKLYMIEDTSLIIYNNYGFSVYGKYFKAPIMRFEQVFNQGHLFIFRIPEPKIPEPKNVLMKYANSLDVYNHIIKFENTIIFIQPQTYGTGLAYLVKIDEDTELNIQSKDETSLVKGWYLFAHKRPADDNAD